MPRATARNRDLIISSPFAGLAPRPASLFSSLFHFTHQWPLIQVGDRAPSYRRRGDGGEPRAARQLRAQPGEARIQQNTLTFASHRATSSTVNPTPALGAPGPSSDG